MPETHVEIRSQHGTIKNGRISPAHDLIPAGIAARIPALYTTEHTPDPIVWLKWFTPDANWTWYVTEFDPADELCFGLVDGFEKELGYFSLDELRGVRGPLGLRIERDLHFAPRPLSEVRGGR